jgi:aspartokinase
MLWEQGFSPLIHQSFSTAMTSGWQSVAVPTKFAADVEKAVHRKFPNTRVTQQNSLATVSLVGRGFRLNPGLLLETQKVLGTPILAVDITDTRITLLIANDELTRALGLLHDKYIL